MAKVLDDSTASGKTYELGGPRLYTFHELMHLLLKEIGRRRVLVPLPFALAKLQAVFLQLLPVPPLTVDQVRLLQQDNVVSANARGFKDLGLVPAALEAILPTYLDQYRPLGYYSRV